LEIRLSTRIRRVSDTAGASTVTSPFPPFPPVDALAPAFTAVLGASVVRLPRKLPGTVVEQCPRQKPAFSGLRLKTLFHRSEIFFRARRALAKKVE